jgi:hypothetical protein
MQDQSFGLHAMDTTGLKQQVGTVAHGFFFKNGYRNNLTTPHIKEQVEIKKVLRNDDTSPLR